MTLSPDAVPRSQDPAGHAIRYPEVPLGPVVGPEKVCVGPDQGGPRAVSRARPVVGGAHHRILFDTEVVQGERAPRCALWAAHRLRMAVVSRRIGGEDEDSVGDGAHLLDAFLHV